MNTGLKTLLVVAGFTLAACSGVTAPFAPSPSTQLPATSGTTTAGPNTTTGTMTPQTAPPPVIGHVYSNGGCPSGATCSSGNAPGSEGSMPEPECPDSIGGGSGPCGGGPAPIAVLPRSSPCYGAMPVNAPIGNGGHNNSISNVFIDSLATPTGFEPIGYEYQTYGGSEFWQFAGQVGVSVSGGVSFVSIGVGLSMNAPLVYYNGNLMTDLTETVSALGFPGSAVPMGALAAAVKAGMNDLDRADCYSGQG